jgi:hypothetical protein
MRNKIKKITKNRKIKFTIVIILLILSLSSIIFARHLNDKPLLYGQETYYHLNQANNYLDGELSILALNPLEGLIVLTEYLPNNEIQEVLIQEILFLILPIVLGLLSTILYLILSEKLEINGIKNFMFMIILIISPSFMYSFSTLSNISMIIFLIILGLFLLSSNKKSLQVIAILPLALVTLFDVFSTIMMLLTISFFYLVWLKDRKYNESDKKNNRKSVKAKKEDLDRKTFNDKLFKILLIIITILTISFKVLLNKALYSVPIMINNFWTNIISDFGGLSGVSVFVVISSILGIYVFLKEKNTFFFLAVLLLIIPSYFYNNNCIIYLNITLAFLAAQAIYWLLERNWSVKEIKNFTIWLLLLGMLFSTLTYIDRIPEYQPSQETILSLEWLEGYISQDDFDYNFVVLTLPQNNDYVEYIVELETFTNSYIITDNVFSTTYPNKLFPILDNNNIKYIYIDPETQERYVDQQGLIFALRNEKFKLIHSEEDYEIWEFDIESDVDI